MPFQLTKQAALAEAVEMWLEAKGFVMPGLPTPEKRGKKAHNFAGAADETSMKTWLLLMGLFGLLYPVASVSAEELQSRVCTDVQTSDASLAAFASYLNREFRALPDVAVVIDRCDYRVRLLLLQGTRQLVVSMLLERSMGDLLTDTKLPSNEHKRYGKGGRVKRATHTAVSRRHRAGTTGAAAHGADQGRA